MWYVYIVRCADKSLYTGISTDIRRRVHEHNWDKTGARYTRGRRPVVLVHKECFKTRSEASRREHQIKSFPRKEKIHLIKQGVSAKTL